MLVGMVYLNTVQKGGETEFFHQEIKLKPVKGTLVIFPAGITHIHKGNAPVSGRKYIINKWALPR